jgi:hypothetical protein
MNKKQKPVFKKNPSPTVDTFQLQVGITVVGTGRVNTMFIRNNFPELSTNLVTALTSLNVDNLSHDCFEFEISYVIEIKLNKLNMVKM